MSDDPLYNIQTQVQAHIEKGPNLKDIPVLIADPGNLIEQVAKSAGLKGIAISIEPAETDLGYSGSGAMFTLAVGIVVTEMVTINRSSTGTNRRASKVVADLISWFRPQNSPPCMLRKIALKQDSGGRVEYVLTGIAKEVLS